MAPEPSGHEHRTITASSTSYAASASTSSASGIGGPTMIITDQAAYSDQIFGLFWLLGYQFSPRPAGLPDQRF